MNAITASSRRPAPQQARPMPLKTPGNGSGGVKQRYLRYQPVAANTLRLRAIVKLFRLTPTDISKRTGFSRSYISRLLNEPDFQGSPDFYRTLEQKLGAVVDGRSGQYFMVKAVAMGRVRGALAMADEQAVERAA